MCDEAPDNIAAEMRPRQREATDAAFAQAAHVVKLDIVNQRVAALSIEPRSVLAWTADDGRLTLRMSTQMPSGVRNSLGNDILGLPEEQVRVTVGDVGGGFGMKTGIYPEDAAVAWGAWTLAAAGEVDRRPQRGIPLRRPTAATCSRGRAGAGATAGSWRCACVRWPTSAPMPPAPAW